MLLWILAVDKKGTREVAKAYLEYLYTEKGQEIAAQNFYRPRNEKVAEKYADQFPKIELFTIEEVLVDGIKHKKHILVMVEYLILFMHNRLIVVIK